MSDRPAAAPAAAEYTQVSLADMMKSVEREIAMRTGVYAKAVTAGTMKPEDARHELNCMLAVKRLIGSHVALAERGVSVPVPQPRAADAGA